VEGGRRKEEGGRRKEEGGRRKEEGERRKAEVAAITPKARAEVGLQFAFFSS
jgi:hypothetical protein